MVDFRASTGQLSKHGNEYRGGSNSIGEKIRQGKLIKLGI